LVTLLGCGETRVKRNGQNLPSALKVDVFARASDPKLVAGVLGLFRNTLLIESVKALALRLVHAAALDFTAREIDAFSKAVALLALAITTNRKARCWDRIARTNGKSAEFLNSLVQAPSTRVKLGASG
jgi:hypothetical protein